MRSNVSPYIQSNMPRHQRPRQPVARGVTQQPMAGRGGIAQPRAAVPQPRPPAYKISQTARNQPGQANAMGQSVAPADGTMSMQVLILLLYFYCWALHRDNSHHSRQSLLWCNCTQVRCIWVNRPCIKHLLSIVQQEKFILLANFDEHGKAGS